ncbi:MAG TPA: glutamate--tRNA ligase [Clostridiales bacterium]|nr:glutamate--tRNA ligase [Clostridiales bacterium]
MNDLADRLFPHIHTLPKDMEIRFPPRNLPEGAKVTRIAPSPTGFVHFGNLFPAHCSERLARQSGGVFLLRIEDTDAKREVEGAVDLIISSFAYYGMDFDEGAVIGGDFGVYGPYRQSQRAQIYQTFAKQLVREGKAYPCFCSEEELNEIRQAQENEKATPGYYGKWSRCSQMTKEEIDAKLDAGLPFVLRLHALGDGKKKFKFTDLVKGKLELPENEIDHVLLKSDGIPTYHFAHAIDDHLMRVTHVVRGEEWLSSLPLHVQLFDMLGFCRPHYMHISLLMKQDGNSKRKLSKRHDPEAALTFYRQEGYPAASVREYVMTVLNSNYEEWRAANSNAALEAFPFDTKKMSASGALFDLQKLNDVSKNTIAFMSAEQVWELLLDWSQEYDPTLYAMLSTDPQKALAILSIGRNCAKPRKDFAMWKGVKEYLDFFYEDHFAIREPFPENVSREDIDAVLTKYAQIYTPDDDQAVWFEKVSNLAAELGFAAKTKEYKQNPHAYKGHVGDISMIIRIAVTGKTMSPDLYEVMKIGGKDLVEKRLALAK